MAKLQVQTFATSIRRNQHPRTLRESLLAPSTEAKEAATPGLPPRTRHKSGKAVPSVSRGGLTTRQKGVLCQMARTAYAILDEHGLTMADVAEATKVDAVDVERGVVSCWASASYRRNVYNALALYYGCKLIYRTEGNKIDYQKIAR
jgi:hypothetical protein